MTLSIDDIRNKHFTLSFRRGYERSEVDSFIEELAIEVKKMLDEIEGPGDAPALVGRNIERLLRALGESVAQTVTEAGKLITEGSEKATEIIDEARARAAELEADTAELCIQMRAATEIELEQLRQEIQRQCGEQVEAAARKRAKLLEDHESLVRKRQALAEVLASLKEDGGANTSSAIRRVEGDDGMEMAQHSSEGYPDTIWSTTEREGQPRPTPPPA